MDGNITKALWLGVGVLFFISVVTIGIYLFSQGRDIANAASEELSFVQNELTQAKFAAYDGTTISGSQVTNTIRKFREKSGSLIVQVSTGTMSGYQYISSGTISNGSVEFSTINSKTESILDSDIKNATDETSSYYINPTGRFNASLIYDSNSVVRAVIFNQK